MLHIVTLVLLLTFLIGLGMTLWAVVGDKSKEASKD